MLNYVFLKPYNLKSKKKKTQLIRKHFKQQIFQICSVIWKASWLIYGEDFYCHDYLHQILQDITCSLNSPLQIVHFLRNGILMILIIYSDKRGKEDNLVMINCNLLANSFEQIFQLTITYNIYPIN